MDLNRFRSLAENKPVEEKSETKDAMGVSELNEYIKALLDRTPFLSDVTVRGEISNFKWHSSGHLYFSLKDEDGSVLPAVMFRGAAQKLRFLPENGMKVLARGSVSVYVRDGKYQLYVGTMEPDGIGSLYLAFEQLKKKLEEEGLFAASRKKPLPPFPRRIGVITSPTGAAVRDIINILGRRYPHAEVVLFPALVQGIDAPASLLAGMQYFTVPDTVDVIIIGRGGGSFEDLFAFNDEKLARAIAASSVPVVSAVGHETDFTVCDFVADCRAPTPSAAAELVVPDVRELLAHLTAVDARMRLGIQNRIAAGRRKITDLASRPVLTRPEGLYREQNMRLLSATEKLNLVMTNKLSSDSARFREITSALKMLNPLDVLLRGYGVVYAADGRVLSSVADVEADMPLSVRMHDGVIHGHAEQVEKKKSRQKRGQI